MANALDTVEKTLQPRPQDSDRQHRTNPAGKVALRPKAYNPHPNPNHRRGEFALANRMIESFIIRLCASLALPSGGGTGPTDQEHLVANPPNGASDAARLQHLESRFAALCAAELQLDLTRGKPCTAQLDLSDGLLAMLSKPLRSQDGIDVRNYGHLDGLPEAKRLGATLLGVEPTDVLVGGNSSLSLMYCCILFAHAFGLRPGAAPWSHEGKVRFLCPVPGYDRHFAICDTFGIEMIPVPLTGAGPDMDEVEALVRRDPTIKGIWCVPKYSNPTGETYSDETVARIAALPRAAGSGFVVMWDNAYAVHDLGPERIQLASEFGP